MIARDRLEPELRRLVVGTLTTLGVVGAIVVPAAAAVRGAPAAWGAAIGIGLVALLFGGAAGLLAAAAGRGHHVTLAVLGGGAVIRLVVYGVVLAGLAPLPGVDGASLALATGVAVVATLGYELRALARMPRLFWIDPTVTASTLGRAPTATRS